MTDTLTEHEIHLSKRLSYLLRHNPQQFGIEVDEHGWADLDAVMGALKLRSETLSRILVLETKPRYQVRDGMIRATHGHSIPVLPDEPSSPPAILYHGTKISAMESIRNTGLTSMRRQFVHLHESIDVASDVAQRRRGESVLLAIDAEQAHRDGIDFYPTQGGVWLVKTLPARYIIAEN